MQRIVLLVVALATASCSVSEWQSRKRDKNRNHTYRETLITPSIGLGNLRVDIDNGGGEDDAVASTMQFDGEFGGRTLRGGLRVALTRSDDDMSMTNGFGDGVRDMDVGMMRLFGHVTVRPSAGNVDIPIRIGPIFEFIHEDSDLMPGLGDSEIRTSMLGVQIEVMPAIHFPVENDGVVSVFGGGRIGTSFAHVAADVDGAANLVDRDDTTALFFGLEAGMRFSVGRFGGGLSYVFRSVDIEDTELNDLTVGVNTPELPGRSYEFNGVLISATFRF